MGDQYPRYLAAAVHAAPVFMDRERSVEKARGLIADAAREGASLVVFSEGYLPGYPLWCLVNPPYAIHDLFTELYANSLTADGPELSAIRLSARKAGIHVSIGFNEKKPESPGTLWASNVIIAPTGDVLCHHQKLVPTYAEKLVWSNGSPEGLRVSTTRLGGLGMLICGENTNPLARYSLLAQGEQVHISAFPPAWPFKGIGADAEYDPRRANEIRASAHSFEGKVYNIVSCGFCDKRTAELSALSETAAEVIAKTPKPASMVTGPAGSIVAGPVKGDREEILIAEIDLAKCVPEKQAHDIVGGYNRFDVFRLILDRNPLKPIHTADLPLPAAEPKPAAGSETTSEERG